MSICTNTLLFYCAPPGEIPSIERMGLVPAPGVPLRLHAHFEEMLKVCEGRILAVNGDAVLESGFTAVGDAILEERPPAFGDVKQEKVIRADGDVMLDKSLPVEAIMNVRPYRHPKSVDAAGGFVMRERAGHRELLLIFRRGVWDLPKGKLDEGESITEAALREVQEELGVQRLSPGRSLGSTIHGYPHKGHFIVKTTHWFEMATPEEVFHPQAEEDIVSVEWFPWQEASRLLGYESLRRHTIRVQQLIESR